MNNLKKSLSDLSPRYREAEVFEVHLHPADKHTLMKELLQEDSPLRGHDYLFDRSVSQGSAQITIKMTTVICVPICVPLEDK